MAAVFWLILSLFVAKLRPGSGKVNQHLSKPNFVILLADDLGIGDVGCFGNTTIRTPNIDYICKNGVKLDHNVVPNSICTPSRAAFQTGRYPIRSGMASGPGDIRVLASNSVQGGLPANETTFASVLQRAGYHTAFIGKWHLGVSCHEKTDYCHHPMKHGFDTFYGLPLSNIRDCHNDNPPSAFTFLHSREQYMRGFKTYILVMFISLFGGRNSALLAALSILTIFSAAGLIHHRLFKVDACILMRNFTVVEQPYFGHDLTQRFATEAAHFIQKQSHEEPFLLFFSFAKVHTTLFTTPYFQNRSVHGRYGDNVEEMDWAVGVVLSALTKSGFLNNTFVYFSSDHGPDLHEISATGEYEGGSKGKFYGGKGTSWEGGVRVPTVAMWNGVLPRGMVFTPPTSSMDVFATVISLAGEDIPKDRHIDGKNIISQLVGESKSTPHEFLFHYCGIFLQAVTYIPDPKVPKVWKAHIQTPMCPAGMDDCEKEICMCYGSEIINHDPPVLYALSEDPYEKRPIDPKSDIFREVIGIVKRGVEHHRQTLSSVPQQLSMNSMVISNIHYCDFPYMSCHETFPHDRIPMNYTFLKN